jgi:hypothetical protein
MPPVLDASCVLMVYDPSFSFLFGSSKGVAAGRHNPRARHARFCDVFGFIDVLLSSTCLAAISLSPQGATWLTCA